MSYKVFLAYMSMSCSVFPTNLRKLENWSTKKETAAPHPHPPQTKVSTADSSKSRLPER